MKQKQKYEHNGSRVILNLDSGPVVIAVATDAVWAAVLAAAANRLDAQAKVRAAS
jgi:hypothetical protein